MRRASGSAGSSRAGEAGGAELELGLGQGAPWVPQPEVHQGPRQRSGGSGAQGSRFPPSVAADLDSGPDSVPDPGTDEEQEEAEQDLRLPQAAVEELPGPSGQGRMGAEGVQGWSSSPQGMRLQPCSLFTGAAEEVWDSGSPLGTPLDTPLGTPPSTPAATEPCATELSPRAAPATGAGGAEPSPEEVRAVGGHAGGCQRFPSEPLLWVCELGVPTGVPKGCGAAGEAQQTLPPALSLKSHLVSPPRAARARDADQKVSRAPPGWAERGWGLSRGALRPLPCPDTPRLRCRSGDQAEPPARLVPGPGPGGLRWVAPEEEGPRGLHGPEVEALLVCAQGPHALLVQPPQREWAVPVPAWAAGMSRCPTRLSPAPQDERAAGLINVATYNLESTREQKKK